MPASLTLKLIAQTAGFQKNLQMSQKAFQKFSKRVLGDSRAFQKIGKELTSLGTRLTVGLTAPIAAIGTSSVFAFANFEKGMKQVQAVSKGTEKDFKDLTKQAKELGRSTVFSATEAAQGMGFLGQAGFDAKEIFEAMPAVLNLAAAANLEVGTSADIASNILAGYGLETENLAEANDVLVKAFTNSNTNLEQLGEAMKLAGPFAKEMGLEFAETTAILGTMGNAGIQATLAGTALNRALVNLAVPTGETKNVIAEFGLETRNTAGKMKSFADILEEIEKKGLKAEDVIRLFGVRAGPKLLKVVGDGSAALRKFTAELKDSGDEAERVAKDKMEGLHGSFTELRSAINGLFIEIGENLAPTLEKMSDSIKDFANKFAELDKDTQGWATSIALLAAALGPAVIVLGAFVGSINTLAPIIIAIKAAFWGPLGIVAAVAVLGIWLVSTKDDWGEFGEAVEGATKILSDFVDEQERAIRNSALNKFLNSITEPIGTGASIVFGEIKKDLLALEEFFESFFQRQIDSLKDVAREAREAVEGNAELSKNMMGIMDKTFDDSLESGKKAIAELTQFQKDALEQAAIDAKVAAQARLADEIKTLVTQEDETKAAFRRIIGINLDANREITGMRKRDSDEHKRLAQSTVDSIVEGWEEGERQKQEAATESDDLIRLLGEGIASTIKLLWDDTVVSVQDAFERAGNTFANIMGQMVAEAIVNGKAIQVEMAAATAGISLVVGLIASVFSKKGGGKSKIQQATEDFLREIKNALKGFEAEVLSSLEKVIVASEKGKEALSAITDAVNEIPSVIENIRRIRGEMDDTLATPSLLDLSQAQEHLESLMLVIVDNSKLALEAIQTEFKLKKEAITEIFNLLKREKGFIKDINRSITDVGRAFFSDKELFAAQKEDIRKLKVDILSATGEDKLGIAGDLKEALLASFETAKSLFGQDNSSQISQIDDRITRMVDEINGLSGADTFEGRNANETRKQTLANLIDNLEDERAKLLEEDVQNKFDLEGWQDKVVEGLKGVKKSGKDAFDDLLDVQRDILKITLDQARDVRFLNQHTENIDAAMKISLRILKEIAEGGGVLSQAQINKLTSAFSTLGITPLAHGGIVTKPVMALLGEGRESEAVIPLSKLKSMMGGGFGGDINIVQNISIPVKDINGLSVSKFEEIIKGNLSRAAKNVARAGYRWPMQSDPT